MARACYPDIKISKQQLQFGECASNERKDYALTVTNRNEDLPMSFSFSKTASFKAMPCKGKLLPGSDHTITISFEPKNLGVITQEMTLEILGGLYKIPLKLSGHCNKVGQRPKGVRGPMARPLDFEPVRNEVPEEDIEARSLPMKRTGFKDPRQTFDQFHGVQAALMAGNEAAVDEYAMILDNKHRANDFLRQERLNRERDARIQQRLRATNRLPPETLEEIEKDPDLGMDMGGPPTPKLMLPDQVDPLFVEKPIGKYEPSQSNLTRLRNKREADRDRVVKRKWKAEPQTQAEVRDCSVELTGEQLQKINAGPQ